ncbi:MAG TPA: hypothetical protein VK907_11630 [Phnomibacter sp.]|nr:hypothetical protein [Phnomibacter sp.]
MNRLIEKITLSKLDGSYLKLLNHPLSIRNMKLSSTTVSLAGMKISR